MATTVNGWPVLFTNRTDGPMPRLRKWNVPATNGLSKGEKYFYLRDGSTGFILMHFIMWFHETIERLDVNKIWDEWGWAVRPVRGQTVGYSNHAGGVAADLNATLHPRGVSIWRSFSAKEIRAIRMRIRSRIYWKCLIWGGDWSTPDGMHVELANVSLSRVEHVARVLMKTRRGQRILKANPGAKRAILS